MSSEIKIAFIGAGAVNFGGGEGPWDHATRLEKIGGIRVVGVADKDPGRAARRLKERRGRMYKGAKAFADYRKMLEAQKPDAVWIGVPPNAHGTDEKGRDMEIVCASAGVHMFIEKPLSSARPDRVRPVARAISKSGVVTSVGYMFRYSRAIDAMRRIIAETPGGPKVFVGLYDCAYSEIRKTEWWDVRLSGGPIVEQATHFVDLARYLVGDVDLESVRAVVISGAERAGGLADAPRDDKGRRFGESVPARFRHPRATAAVWKFANGAVGSLTHGTLLHREKYETGIEVWGDGLRLTLSDPYGECVLQARRPGSEAAQRIAFKEDDPYLTEDRAFIDAVRRGDSSAIRSPYSDALKTFELTWAITERSRGG